MSVMETDYKYEFMTHFCEAKKTLKHVVSRVTTYQFERTLELFVLF